MYSVSPLRPRSIFTPYPPPGPPVAAVIDLPPVPAAGPARTLRVLGGTPTQRPVDARLDHGAAVGRQYRLPPRLAPERKQVDVEVVVAGVRTQLPRLAAPDRQ